MNKSNSRLDSSMQIYALIVLTSVFVKMLYKIHGCDNMSKECEMCEWFVWGGVDIHSISNYGNEFEALVNVTIKCEHCEKIHELCMSATDEV